MKNRNCTENWIKTYLEYTENYESCEAYNKWTAVSIIAGTLGRKVYADRDAYILYPNQYIILVGESGGARKSSAIRAGVPFLVPIIEKSSYIRGKLSMEALIKEMQRIITYSEAGKEIKIQGTVFLLSSELATLLGKAVYQQEIVPFLTDIYDSDEIFHWITIKDGRRELKKLCVNLIAASTPQWLASSISDETVHGGFTGRTVMVMQNEHRSIPLPSLRKDLFPLLMEDLQTISFLKGKILFSKEAKEYFIPWYHKYSKELQTATGYKVPFLQRMHDHLVKLAVVISLAESNELIIEKRHFVSADKDLQEIKNKMESAYVHVGTSPMAKLRELILKMIWDKGGVVSHSDILPKVHRNFEAYQVREAARGLMDMGIIDITKETIKGSTKPRRVYKLKEHILQNKKDSIIESLLIEKEIDNKHNIEYEEE